MIEYTPVKVGDLVMFVSYALYNNERLENIEYAIVLELHKDITTDFKAYWFDTPSDAWYHIDNNAFFLVVDS